MSVTRPKLSATAGYERTGRRRRASLTGDLLRLTVIWVILVIVTLTMLGPLPFGADTGRDRVFGVFTQSMRDTVLPWAIALDVVGFVLLPVVWAWFLRR
jgi:hypothetical protein